MTSIDELKMAHRWTLRKTDLFENEWVEMLFEHGQRFAVHFSRLFPYIQNTIENVLLKSPAEEGNAHNWFWTWWKLKWMQDDWNYITDKVYNQAISYTQYKTYMLHCEILEQDLFNLIHDKKVIL
jgi:hypothetical protein